MRVLSDSSQAASPPNSDRSKGTSMQTEWRDWLNCVSHCPQPKAQEQPQDQGWSKQCHLTNKPEGKQRE